MTYCTNCHTPRDSSSRFCTGCGVQLSAASPTHPHSRGRFVIALTALVLLLSGGGVAAWAALVHGTSPPALPNPATPPNQSQVATPSPDRSDPSRTTSALLGTASASASCISSAGRDVNGTIFTYEPDKAIDNVRDTAWRCDGDGVGQWLKISFQSSATLTSIGIMPGYAKTDPSDGTDRYAQNRRISAVSYTFDDGSTVTQSLGTGALDRSTQTVSLPNVSTSHMTITILSSVRGEATGGQEPFDKVAISEIAVSVR
ncbi:MAG: NADase-type glycan-binding domain-containing protein [Pseudonocardiaceae bacterium]